MMRVFFRLGVYSMVLDLPALPCEGQEIEVTRENLKEKAGGVDTPGVYGTLITVEEQIEDTGWDGSDVKYPAFSISVL